MINFITVLIGSVIVFQVKIASAEQQVFEFGTDGGRTIYNKDGIIHLLTYETTIDISVPEDTAISYIKVTVDSLSPPKVDYVAQSKQVTIKYTWVQVTASTYSILVKGTPIYKL